MTAKRQILTNHRQLLYRWGAGDDLILTETGRQRLDHERVQAYREEGTFTTILLNELISRCGFVKTAAGKHAGGRLRVLRHSPLINAERAPAGWPELLALPVLIHWRSAVA